MNYPAYTTVFGIENLSQLANAKRVAFDSETLQLQPEAGKLRLLQFACQKRRLVVVLDCFELDDAGWATLQQFFDTPRSWIAHNAAFDLGWLQEYGLYPSGSVHCTFIAGKLLTNGLPRVKHNLAALAKKYLGVEVSKEEQRSDWSVAELTRSQMEYAAKDAEIVAELDKAIHDRIAIGSLGPAYALECRALQALAQMKRTGLPWNREALEQTRDDYQHDIEEIGKEFLRELDNALPEEEKLPRLEDGSFNLRPKTTGRGDQKLYAGFNLNSPKQLLHKFTVLLGKQPIDPKSGKPSTARGALKEYAADSTVIGTYLAWKRAEKRRQMVVSILDHMDPHGFVKASYWQLGAESGRMSCSDPNNQQIPRDKEFRECVQAPDGWLLVDADFGQMELRLAAAVAKDERMTAAFQAGEDLHTVTAEALGCDRQIAKSANFGLLYGSGATGLRNYAGGMGVTLSLDEAKAIRQQWLDTYYGIKAWQKQMALLADKTQGDPWAEIRIPGSGMRRYVPGDMNRLTVRANTPIQGAGAAILKHALGSLWAYVLDAGEDEVKIAGAVHDELILIVKEDKAEKWAAILKQVMESSEKKWLGEIPPLAEVNIGKTWAETH
jgi:DNA polymerase I-like protein with 3'-5' exonuclease and polymerase domains